MDLATLAMTMPHTELLKLLEVFISFETIDGNTEVKQECIDWIESVFFHNWKHRKIKGVVGNAPYIILEHPNPDWLWFAHTDVVPGDPGQFALQVDGDTIRGRGVKDMKGAALPFLIALRDALSDGEDPKVSVLLSSDEEVAGPSIPQLLDEGKLNAPVAFTPDTGSNPNIVVAHKGVIWAKLIAEGRGGHSAMPWASENPIDILMKGIAAIRENFPDGEYEDWQMTVTPTKLEGSTAANQIGNTAIASLDIRYPSEICSNAADAIAKVSAVLPDGCRIEEHISAGPLSTRAGHPAVLNLQSIAQEITQTVISIGREHGATDARYFSARGIPAFLYGPIGGGLHAKDEWVSHSSLMHHYDLYRRLLSYQE